MDTLYNLKKLQEEERKNDRISAIITFFITLVLVALMVIWKAWRATVPPPGEVYEVVGAIDFGDLREGSKQINTLDKSRVDPAPVPKPKAKPVKQAEVAETTPQPDPIITNPEPSPVKQPDTPPKEEPDPTPPKPAETVIPEEKPQPEETPNDNQTEETESTTESKPDPSPSNKPSGANQGNKDEGVGNQGTPDIKTLDPDGLYSFGEGLGGGASRRRPLALPKPVYNVQEEGDMVFEFIIKPDGTVANARPKGVATKPGLVNAGRNAIRKWRFTKLPPNAPQVNQRVTVTIKFRLRG